MTSQQRAALLVPPPGAAEIGAIRNILESHNPLEEGPGGFYADIERMVGNALPALLARVREVPPVRLAAHVDTEVTRRSIEQLVREAEASRRTLAGSDHP